MNEFRRKERVGIVLSTNMQKTAVVQVTRLVQHSLFKKVIKQRKKYAVHDEKKSAKAGDTVRIRETKPLSKTKHWRLVEILSSSKS